MLKSCAPRVVVPGEPTARLTAHRGRDLTASFVTHRARPPASEHDAVRLPAALTA